MIKSLALSLKILTLLRIAHLVLSTLFLRPEFFKKIQLVWARACSFHCQELSHVMIFTYAGIMSRITDGIYEQSRL